MKQSKIDEEENNAKKLQDLTVILRTILLWIYELYHSGFKGYNFKLIFEGEVLHENHVFVPRTGLNFESNVQLVNEKPRR